MGIELTDAELANFIAPGRPAEEQAALVKIVTERGQRELINRMAQLEIDIALYGAGLGVKPDYAIICGDREVRHSSPPQPSIRRRK